MKKYITLSLIVGLLCVCFSGCGKKDSGITLGQYKGLTYKEQTISVSEDEINRLLEGVRNSSIEYEKDESRNETMTKNGDVVNIDYTGILDGESTPFQGGSAKGSHLELGSASFISGFEEGLVGKRVGDTVTLNLTFPTQYYAQYAGKKVTFTVTINAIEKKIVPEMSDALIAKYTDNKIVTVQAYKEYANQYLLAQKNAEFESSLKAELVKRVVQDTKFGKLDQDKLDQYYSDVVKYYNALASRKGLTLETYVANSYGKSMEEFYADLKGVAEETMKEEIVLNEIISKENIVLSDEQYNSMISEYMGNYGYTDRAKFETDYTVAKIRQSMLYDLAMKLITDSATPAK